MRCKKHPLPYAAVPLRRSVDVVHVLAAREDVGLDAHVQKLGDAFFSTVRDHRITTKVSVADALGVDRFTLEAKLGRLANCLLHCDRVGLQALGETLRVDATDLCLFVEVARYDATKIETTTEQSVKDIVGQIASSAIQGSIKEVDVIEPATESIIELPIVASKTSAPSYLLGSDHVWACLVKIPDGEEHRLVAFFGTVLAWVQLIDRSTAETCKRSLSEISATFIDAHQYKLKVRASNTDSASSNFRTEDSIAQDREGSWVNIKLPCFIHKGSTSHTKTFELSARDVSAMVHFSLSVSTSASMAKFRKAAIAVICERLVIKRGSPSEGAATPTSKTVTQAHHEWELGGPVHDRGLDPACRRAQCCDEEKHTEKRHPVCKLLLLRALLLHVPPAPVDWCRHQR